jgi:hypothetical protein
MMSSPRYNHVPNLEALLRVVERGKDLLARTWSERADAKMRSAHGGSYAQLEARLADVHRLTSAILGALGAGQRAEDLDEVDQLELVLKEAGRIADELRPDWPYTDGAAQSAQFIEMLSDASEVTMGPAALASTNWLVSAARDARFI